MLAIWQKQSGYQTDWAVHRVFSSEVTLRKNKFYDTGNCVWSRFLESDMNYTGFNMSDSKYSTDRPLHGVSFACLWEGESKVKDAFFLEENEQKYSSWRPTRCIHAKRLQVTPVTRAQTCCCVGQGEKKCIYTFWNITTTGGIPQQHWSGRAADLAIQIVARMLFFGYWSPN